MDIKRTLLLSPALVAVFAFAPAAVSEASAGPAAAAHPAKPCHTVAACSKGFQSGYDRGRQCLGKMQGITAEDENYMIGFDRGYERARAKYCGEEKVDE